MIHRAVRKLFVGVFFIAFLGAGGLRAQGGCVTIVDSLIPDNGTLSAEIQVSGLANDDLSSTQALCGIRIRFNHSYIGDLTGVLFSPAGQEVQLIGELTNTIAPTNLTTWDVTFTRCSDVAMPDGGFANTWSNEQPWQVFTNYSGTYYPFSGCLEDFNSGSANGIWRLELTDNDLNAVGTLFEVELIFCDATGLACQLCLSDAGVFPEPILRICEGDAIDDGLFIPEISGNPPPPSEYGFEYLVSNDDTNYTYQSTFSAAGLPPGTYRICGMSFQREDSTELYDQLDPLNLPEIYLAFAAGAIDYCADFTQPCVRLTVLESSDTTFLQEEICGGDSYTVGNEVFNRGGVYVVDLQSSQGCDSVVVLDLTINRVNVQLVQGDTLSCQNATTTLEVTGLPPGAGVYAWETDGGSILSDTSQRAVTIGGPGIYSVTVTDQNGCSVRRSWSALVSGSQPFVSLTNGVINCIDTVHQFNTITFPSDVTIEWNGPNGFTSNEKDPPVVEGGQYVVTVTDSNGCSVSVSGSVLLDTASLPVNISITRRDCDQQRVRLDVIPGVGDFTWTGPGGFTGNSSVVVVTLPGEYIAQRTTANGCIASSSILVSNDFNQPDVSIISTDDTLNCAEQVTLSAISSVGNSSYLWFNELGQQVGSDSTLMVDEPGIFTVEITAPNLCQEEADFTVEAGDDLFAITTFTDTITCIRDTVLIGVDFTTIATSISWSGPGLVDSTGQFVRVEEPGIYRAQIVDTSGCIAFGDILVGEDFVPINFLLDRDTLTCDSTTSLLSFTPLGNDQVMDITWTLNDSVIGKDSVVIAEIPGDYFLTLIGQNGCERTKRAIVEADTTPPLLFIEPGQIGCQDSVQLFTVLVDSVDAFSWSGPAGYQSTARDPFIYSFGDYQLVVTGANGCTQEYTTEVQNIAVLPDLSVSAELLDCLDSMAVLEAFSADSAIDFSWFRGAQLISDTSSASVGDTGSYVVQARSGVTNCLISDTVVIAPPVFPAVYAVGDTLNCRDTTVQLTATGDSTNMTFTWFDTLGDSIGSGPSISVAADGTYRVSGRWINGCTSDTTAIVGIDTVSPVAVIVTDQVVRCEIQTIVLDGSMSMGGDVVRQWTSPSGNIIGADDQDSVLVRGEGLYVLRLTDTLNFCSDTDTLAVMELGSTLDSMELTLVPECQGNAGGTIIIDTVYSTVSPLEYSIGVNGGTMTPVFDSLRQGIYTITVIDSFGCRLDSTIEITNTSSSSTVNLGPDQSLIVGDPVVLSAVLNIDSTTLSDVYWQPTLPCDSCLTNTVFVNETTDFTIYIADEFGCVASDELTVFISERGQFYVPNIFSPNEDGVNDFVEVVAHPGIRMVKRFYIFDRWGNQVFTAENYMPGAPNGRWDGRLNGEFLNPAVFPYVLEIELLTGKIERHSGDITLIR